MNVTINIHFKTQDGSKVLQSGTFPLRKKPEQIAYDFWKQIKRDFSYRVSTEEVILNEEKDITKLVRQLDGAPLPNIDLPF